MMLRWKDESRIYTQLLFHQENLLHQQYSLSIFRNSFNVLHSHRVLAPFRNRVSILRLNNENRHFNVRLFPVKLAVGDIDDAIVMKSFLLNFVDNTLRVSASTTAQIELRSLITLFSNRTTCTIPEAVMNLCVLDEVIHNHTSLFNFRVRHRTRAVDSDKHFSLLFMARTRHNTNPILTITTREFHTREAHHIGEDRSRKAAKSNTRVNDLSICSQNLLSKSTRKIGPSRSACFVYSLRDLLVDDFIFTPTISSCRARLREVLFPCIFFGANSTTISTLIIALVTTSATSTTKLLLHLLIILFTIFHENVENLFQIHILLSIKARRNNLSEVIDGGEEVVKTNSILTLLTISNRIQFIQHLSDSHRRAHDIGRIPTNVVRCHLTGSHMMEQKSKNFDTSQYSQSNRMNSLNEFLSIFKNRNGIRLCIQTNSHLIILDRLTLHHSVKLKE